MIQEKIFHFPLYAQADPQSSRSIRQIAEAMAPREKEFPFLGIRLHPRSPVPGEASLKRFTDIAADTSAGMVYADYYEQRGEELCPHPLIDCQRGSLRDDFDFGDFLLFNTRAFREAAAEMREDYRFAGLYDLRLRLCRRHPVVHINECLYTLGAEAEKEEGEAFRYVDPKNREAQREMERACSEHLRRIGAWLPERRKRVDLWAYPFGTEASVIIPVRNRAATIAQAIASATGQATRFEFNVLVVDNHSTDGTTDIVRSLAAKDRRILHLRPEARDLGIGGCWNLAVGHPACGRFAVQLDSDDVYSHERCLERIVDCFHARSCALVIGSYRLCNFALESIPPGVIDHREWTPENGHNNALRINGLGAPRAFFTPLLRSLGLPNTSYGEDYATVLRICREYAVERLYEVLYLCRRWEDNSDARIEATQTNAHNFYKDRLRTWEIEARIRMNKPSSDASPQ
ncbi:MAG: glycosyltransferase family 2 protein [Tannerellaceae bacterium]|jgi:hypothetical protein|nr:glycosyltransferase family 2 protein [Tannerellaceae bacterium]